MCALARAQGYSFRAIVPVFFFFAHHHLYPILTTDKCALRLLYLSGFSNKHLNTELQTCVCVVQNAGKGGLLWVEEVHGVNHEIFTRFADLDILVLSHEHTALGVCTGFPLTRCQ